MNLTSLPIANAAKVRGRVENWRLLTNPVWADARSPKRHGFSFREPVPTVRGEFRHLFPHIPKELCIAAIATAKQKAPPPILIRVGGGRTTPVTIVVPPGTQLSFQNTDPFKHRLYGVGIKSFAAADTMRGGLREWTVPAEGTFEIRDELAPSLRMWVVGEPHVAAIAYPSLKGEFVLSPPAAGEYTVVAYFAGKKVGKERAVSLQGKDLDVSKDPIRVAEQTKRTSDGDDIANQKKSE
ncbi:MAG TPA: hypothetical protein VK524_01015 [Polyangiaceae bacterium]|nr:hypothetical protein [Polyangiaceae bacterium]